MKKTSRPKTFGREVFKRRALAFGRVFFSFSVQFPLLIGADRQRKLVGAGGVVPALDAFERFADLIDIFALYELGDALQVSAASSDEFYVMDIIFPVHVKDDLARAGPFCVVSKHCKNRPRG